MRKHVVVIAASVALAANVGFLGGQLHGQPDDADATQAAARSGQASETRVLRSIDRRLRGVQATLTAINDNIGSFDYSGSSLRKNTKDIARSTWATCVAVAASPSSC